VPGYGGGPAASANRGKPPADELVLVSETEEESRRSRAAGPIAIFLATLLVAAVAVAIIWLGKDSPEQSSGPTNSQPQDGDILVPQEDPLPQLERGRVTLDKQGDPVFSWNNPSPKQGDQYKWWLLATQDQVHTTGEDEIALPRSDFGEGAVCIEVQLVREQRTSQQKLRICEQ
jgi:hypothetical protein